MCSGVFCWALKSAAQPNLQGLSNSQRRQTVGWADARSPTRQACHSRKYKVFGGVLLGFEERSPTYKASQITSGDKP